MHTLTIRFKGLRWNGQMFRPQEIRFRREPESFFVVNKDNGAGCCVYVNTKPYVWFCVLCEDWG